MRFVRVIIMGFERGIFVKFLRGIFRRGSVEGVYGKKKKEAEFMGVSRLSEISEC